MEMTRGYNGRNHGRRLRGIMEYVMDVLGCRMGLPGNGISEGTYSGDVRE